MKKKNIINKNFLENIPVRNSLIKWSQSDDGKVTLEIENTGFFNSLAQKFFKKPRISYVHLDENGSFVWPIIDGEKNIIAIGEYVKEEFGEKAEPLYNRLVQYFHTLEAYDFVEMKKPNNYEVKKD